MGSDQRHNRVAVVTSHAGIRQTKTQAVCRWQGEHRGGTAETIGSEESGGEEDHTNRGEEGDSEEDIRKEGGEEENGGEKCSGKRGGEDSGVGRTLATLVRTQAVPINSDGSIPYRLTNRRQ